MANSNWLSCAVCGSRYQAWSTHVCGSITPPHQLHAGFAFTCAFCGEPLDGIDFASHRCGWAYTPVFPECPTDGERPPSFVCRRGHVHPGNVHPIMEDDAAGILFTNQEI